MIVHFRVFISAAALFLIGCAAGFPMPMTAGDLARYDSGPALVAYLGQPDASSAVCDLRATTPHVDPFTPEVEKTLIAGLVDRKIDPAIWQRCVTVLLKGLDKDGQAQLFDRLLRAYLEVLEDSDVATDPALADRLDTLHRLYLDRKPGVDAHAEVVAEIVQELGAKSGARAFSSLENH